MKEINIQKGIEQLKKVSLTNEEKSKMLHNLSLYADVHQPIPSTHSLFSFFNISLNRKLAYVLTSIMITITLGGSAVYASEQSLPGDLLYPIKTKIAEPIKMAMATTPKEKAKVEIELADKRLSEAETLDKRGKLTPNLNKEISKKFDSHVSGFYKIKKQIEKKDSTSSIEENNKIQKDFENKMDSHAEILNRFNRDSNGLEKTIKKEVKKDRENIIPIKQLDSRNASSVDLYKRTQFQSED
ncbi:MAG: DUF5667 domain-containing protein [Candidatus Paceibacterota bacterium]|jgi:hypothetical protein